jgi:mannose-1-phosphate guanylyltransferase
VLDRIPPKITVSIERETFPRMLDQRGQLYAMTADVYWLDIGMPETYLAAHVDVMRGELGVPPVTGAKEIEPGVWVQPGAVIDAASRVVPPVLVGADTAVGPGVLLSATSVGAGCTVGYGARVERSVLLDGAQVGRAVEMVDTIVGPEATIADGDRLRDEIRVHGEP